MTAPFPVKAAEEQSFPLSPSQPLTPRSGEVVEPNAEPGGSCFGTAYLHPHQPHRPPPHSVTPPGVWCSVPEMHHPVARRWPAGSGPAHPREWRPARRRRRRRSGRQVCPIHSSPGPAPAPPTPPRPAPRCPPPGTPTRPGIGLHDRGRRHLAPARSCTPVSVVPIRPGRRRSCTGRAARPTNSKRPLPSLWPLWRLIAPVVASPPSRMPRPPGVSPSPDSSVPSTMAPVVGWSASTASAGTGTSRVPDARTRAGRQIGPGHSRSPVPLMPLVVS